MDVYLMTSSAEGTPLVILEAMSMKKPIISTNVGGISEQVVNGSTGYLFNPSKKEEIIEFLTDLLDNPQKRQIFGENGRKRVKKFYSLEKCVNKHKLLYENLINK
jgi:glycosyltransferase involved in cell wall biosynthesis